jgi:hypothetical protein
MGLVLREGLGTGWTTGSGLEGPTGDIENESKEEPKFPNLSKSPRRKMRVAFTCNKCGERTIRAINPLAYTDGTVFVQVPYILFSIGILVFTLSDFCERVSWLSWFLLCDRIGFLHVDGMSCMLYRKVV